MKIKELLEFVEKNGVGADAEIFMYRDSEGLENEYKPVNLVANGEDTLEIRFELAFSHK